MILIALIVYAVNTRLIDYMFNTVFPEKEAIDINSIVMVQLRPNRPAVKCRVMVNYGRIGYSWCYMVQETKTKETHIITDKLIKK